MTGSFLDWRKANGSVLLGMGSESRGTPRYWHDPRTSLCHAWDRQAHPTVLRRLPRFLAAQGTRRTSESRVSPVPVRDLELRNLPVARDQGKSAQYQAFRFRSPRERRSSDTWIRAHQSAG